MKLLIFLSILILLSACQKEKFELNASLNLGSLSESGHFMILGTHQDGSQKIIASTETSNANLSIDLIPGTWNFKIIHWDKADGELFSGKMNCGSMDNVEIAEDTSLDFSLTTNGCAEESSSLVPSSGYLEDVTYSGKNTGLNQIKKLRFTSCHSQPLDPGTTDCTLIDKGKTRSFKIIHSNFSQEGLQKFESSSIESSCQDMASNHAKDTLFRLPLGTTGNSFSFFQPQIALFDKANCSGNMNLISLGDSIANSSANNDKWSLKNLNDGYASFYIQDSIDQNSTPKITSSSPSTLPDIGFGTLTINGENLSSVSSVLINSTDPCLFISHTDTQITCSSPSESIGNHPIKLVYSDGELLADDPIQYVAASFEDYKRTHIQTIDQASLLSTNTISIESGGVAQLPTGQFIVYKTDNSNYGIMEIQSYNVSTNKLTIKVKTFSSDGSVLASASGLFISGTFAANLDDASETSTLPAPTDFWNEAIDASTSQLNPQNGAEFHVLP